MPLCPPVGAVISTWRLYSETVLHFSHVVSVFCKMPVFVLFTNVAKADIPANFLQEMSAVIANTTGKPEGVS